MSKKLTKVSSNLRGKLHRIYFCSPKETTSIDRLAERLIGLKPVQEVFLTDLDDGYVAKIRFFDDKEPEKPAVYLSKSLGKEFGSIVKS